MKKVPVKIENLDNFVKNSGMSIAALERKSSLTRNTIQNILYKKSQTTSLTTLQAVAKALNKPLESIADISQATLSGYSQTNLGISEAPQWSFDLFLECVKAMHEEMTALHATPDYDSIEAILKDIYTHTIETPAKEVDRVFIRWLLKRKFYL